jgi:hypothetical protein
MHVTGGMADRRQDGRRAPPQSGSCGRGNAYTTGPRYGPINDQGLKISRFREGARDERLQSYLALVAVEFDAELEGVLVS